MRSAQNRNAVYTKRRTAVGFSKAPGAGVVLSRLIFAQNFHFVQSRATEQNSRSCPIGCYLIQGPSICTPFRWQVLPNNTRPPRKCQLRLYVSAQL